MYEVHRQSMGMLIVLNNEITRNIDDGVMDIRGIRRIKERPLKKQKRREERR